MNICLKLLVLATVLILSGCPHDNGDPQQSDGIYFTAEKDIVNAYELYVTREGENEPIKLSVFPDNDFRLSVDNFSISPDRRWIAYSITSSGNEQVIYIVPTSGGNPIYIAGSIERNEIVRSFSWSPDSSRLAYIMHSVPQGSNLFVVNANGSNSIKISTELIPEPPYNTFQLGVDSFSWSHDSRFIAYRTFLNSPVQSYLFVTTPDGSMNTQVSNPVVLPTGGIDAFAWSPDSEFLSMIGRYNGRSELYTTRYDGSQNIQVTQTNDIEFIISDFLEWDNNGDYIAYIKSNLDRGFDLYCVQPNGQNNVGISIGNPLGDGVLEFHWSPTENRLAYIATQRSELYLADADGSNNILVSKASIPDRFINLFGWSPDGNYLAYISDQEIDNILELHTFRISNSVLIKAAGVETIADFGGISDFQWSSNGNYIGFRAFNFDKNAVSLFVSSTEGEIPTQLSPSNNSGKSVFGYTWSSDNNIAYIGEFDMNDSISLYRASVDGQIIEKISGEGFEGDQIGQLLYINQN